MRFLLPAAGPFILLCWVMAAVAGTAPHAVLLEQDAFETIRFNGIPPSRYRFEQGQLIAEVDNSASFLMQAFDTVKRVTAVSFRWQKQGTLRVRDAVHESRRDGDDALFRLGLLLKGEAEDLPGPFVPKWLQRVRSLLHFPSESMLYLLPGARHAAGERWPSPYNARVTMVAMASQADAAGWQLARYRLPQAAEVVAIWLMADGDSTASRFTTRVKDIVLEVQPGAAVP